MSNKPDTVGWFAVCVYRPKYEVNFGSIWRTAMLYDVAFISTVNSTFVGQQPTDTINVRAYVPYFNYQTIEDLKANMPFGTKLVGVELEPNAKPITRFVHPQRAIYLFGAEDVGLPPDVIEQCDATIYVPTARPWSMNLANCAAITMYDRDAKAHQRARILP